MNIKKIFMSIVFTFICIFSIGVMNVNAETLVETEEQLRNALSGSDPSITEVKLGGNIELTEGLIIYPVNELTLDLGGFTIDGHEKSKNVSINYGKNNLASGSLTIKDSSDSKTGTIKSYWPIVIYKYSTSITSASYKLTVDGGKFYTLKYSSIFELNSSNYSFDFTVNDGYFEPTGDNSAFLQASDIITNDRTLIVNLNKLTMKGRNARLVYSSEKDFKISDVVSEDSKINLKYNLNGKEAEITDRTVSVTELNALKYAWGTALGEGNITYYFDTIEIVKKEGFDVDNVTLNETYGYESGTAKGIKITNRGANPLKVKTVSVSNTDGTTSTHFIVNDTVGTKDYLEIASLDSNETRYTIKAKTGLAAGEYTAVITVTDENDKTYTSTVKVVVAKKPVEGLGVSYDGDWKYKETPTTLTKSGVEGLSIEQYVVDYSVHDINDWQTTVPTLAGNYDVRIRVTDPNYDNTTEAITQFNIKPIDTQIKIVPNNNEWTYDGNSHSDNGYKVYYGSDTEGTTGSLPNGDTITAVITGSVTDYVDNKTGNNKITSYTITNSDGFDVKGCYSNINEGTGNLTIKSIETQIFVTADSATKAYDGSALTKDSYTYTDGVLVAGDELKATITGSQTFVGSSANVVTDVKVYRGEKNITSNYRFGTHNGTLEVVAASQTPTIATQYVVKGNVKTIDDLKQAVSGTEGNLDFAIVDGNTLVEYVEGTGYKAKDLGTVKIKVTAQSLNVGGDASPEYSEASTTFNLEITNKEEVTIEGIANNQEFTYDGSTHTPLGTLTFSNSNVTTSDLEISYVGIDGTTYSSTTAPTNAGTYNVTYKIKDSNENYAGEKAFKFTIKKVQLAKVTLKQSSFVYT